jgi:hypothetical protein
MGGLGVGPGPSATVGGPVSLWVVDDLDLLTGRRAPARPIGASEDGVGRPRPGHRRAARPDRRHHRVRQERAAALPGRRHGRTRRPDHLVFVLVDYKGGSAFDECARLPHTVGMVTDLDDHLGERALRSLEAELHHRERTAARGRARRTCPSTCARGPARAAAPAGGGHRRVRHAGHRAAGLPRRPGRRRPARPQPRRPPDPGDPAASGRRQRQHQGQHQPADRAPGAGRRRLDRHHRPRDAANLSRATPGRAYVRLGPGDVELVQTALSTGLRGRRTRGPGGPAPLRCGRDGRRPGGPVPADSSAPRRGRATPRPVRGTASRRTTGRGAARRCRRLPRRTRRRGVPGTHGRLPARIPGRSGRGGRVRRHRRTARGPANAAGCAGQPEGAAATGRPPRLQHHRGATQGAAGVRTRPRDRRRIRTGRPDRGAGRPGGARRTGSWPTRQHRTVRRSGWEHCPPRCITRTCRHPTPDRR